MLRGDGGGGVSGRHSLAEVLRGRCVSTATYGRRPGSGDGTRLNV